MKFKEIKKRKVYKTWQNKNRRIGIVSYIYQSPKNFFHFSIFCAKQNIKYSSLEDNLIYETIEEVEKAIIQWHKIYKA